MSTSSSGPRAALLKDIGTSRTTRGGFGAGDRLSLASQPRSPFIFFHFQPDKPRLGVGSGWLDTLLVNTRHHEQVSLPPTCSSAPSHPSMLPH